MLLKSQAISVIFMNTFVTSSHIGLTRPVGETMMECVLEDCLVGLGTAQLVWPCRLKKF